MNNFLQIFRPAGTFFFLIIKFLKIIPKTKPCFSSSPDGSGNPFAFFFKKQKIEADSRNP
jgi:hypothetical protein